MARKQESTGRRKRLRARFTLTGWVFACAFALILSAALNTGINLLYMLSAALLSFLVVSFFLARASLKKLEGSITAPHATHRDLEVAITLAIENRKRLLPTAGVRIESTNAPGEEVGYLRLLARGERSRLRVRELFRRRGEYPVPAYTLVTSFPFGLVETWRTWRTDARILVYPRVSALRTSAAEQASGSRYRARTASGDGDEFYSMREYMPGDDVRRISWKASARLGKLIVRELARQNSKFVLFLLDTRKDPSREDPAFEERFEEAIELVASLANTLLERQYNVAIECPQAHVEGGEGSGQKRRVLEFLARLHPVSTADHPNFDEHHCKLDTHLPALLMVSPDPSHWGRRRPGTSLRVLDPREVIHA